MTATTNCGKRQQAAQTATLHIVSSPFVPVAIIFSRATFTPRVPKVEMKARIKGTTPPLPPALLLLGVKHFFLIFFTKKYFYYMTRDSYSPPIMVWQGPSLRNLTIATPVKFDTRDIFCEKLVKQKLAKEADLFRQEKP